MPNGQAPIPSEQELRIAQAKRAKLARRTLWIVAALILVGASIWAVTRLGRKEMIHGPGQFIPDQGAPHVAPGTKFDYNSNPPTSGPHFATPSEWGVYKEEIHDQILIHNLEHGGIWIAYKPSISAEVVSKLEAIAKEFGRKVIMAPRPANDTDIALAAWNHLDKFSAGEFSEERVRAFIKAYRNKGPEFVP